MDIPSHHLIYGTCKDILTGDTIVDTDDERIRQAIIRQMLEKKGYARQDLVPRRTIETMFHGRFVTSTVDLSFLYQERCFMILRYGPGSLVTRERPALAAARVLEPGYQVPFAVVTNGRDAELLDTAAGKVIATGMDAIYGRKEVEEMAATIHYPPPLGANQRDRELRILNTYDFEQCCVGCPCPLPGAHEG